MGVRGVLRILGSWRTFAVAVVVLGLFPFTATAQKWTTWVSPGISLGYLFGPDGGTVFGLEVSSTYWPGDTYYLGAVTKLELFKGNMSVHLGCEGGWGPVGLSVGPTWARIRGSGTMGFSASIYGLVGIIPYFSYHWFSEHPYLEELGCYLKIPCQVAGPHLNFRQ
jgi:hypothetical protein